MIMLQGPDQQNFECKIVIIFLSIVGSLKNHHKWFFWVPTIFVLI